MKSKANSLYLSLIFVPLIILASLLIIVLNTSSASALSGASTYFPDTSPDGQARSYAIVQVTGSRVVNADIKMKARTTVANVYVPKSLEGQNITIRIVNGCHGTPRDNETWAGDTQFRIINRTTLTIEATTSTSDGGVCSGTSDIDMTFNATAMNTASSQYRYSFALEGTTEYNVYQFIADGIMSETNNTSRYLNAFGLERVTGGVQVGITDHPVQCRKIVYPISCPTERNYNGSYASWVYTSFYGPSPAWQMESYNQRIKIRNTCIVSGGSISFYDLDANDPSLTAQNALEIYLTRNGSMLGVTSPNGTYSESLSRLGIINWEPGVPGLLNAHPDVAGQIDSGGLNDEYLDIPGLPPNVDTMFSGLGNFEANVDYELVINDIDSDNAIQILPNYPLCQTPPNTDPTGSISATCAVIAGTARATVTVNYNVTDAEGDTLSLALTKPSEGNPSSSTTTASRTGTGTGSFPTFDIDRRTADYSVSATVNDNKGGGDKSLGTATFNCPLPPPPTVDPNPVPGGAVTCETFNFTISQTEAGFRYDARLQVSTNGGATWADASPGVTRNDIAAGNHSFSEVAQWRDFRNRQFRVVAVNRTFTSISGSTAGQSVGPCLRMTCNGATFSGTIEVNRPFSMNVGFAIRRNYSDTTQLAQIGSRGTAETYNVGVTFTPAVAAGPTNPLPSGQSLNSGTASTISHTVGQYTAPSTPSTSSVSYVLDSTTNNNADVSCPDAATPTNITFSAIPYFQSFRGDIIAGYGMRDAAGACTVTGSGVFGNVNTTLTNASEYVGAGSQYNVFALGNIRGFRSVITQTGLNALPWSNVFANTVPPRSATTPVATGNYGGSFDSALCTEDWFHDRPTTTLDAPGSTSDLTAQVDLASLSGVSRYGESVRFRSSTPLTGNRKVFVDGDIIIGDGSAALQEVMYDTSWNSLFEIPSLILVATGNIYIDDNITRLNGILVAQGSVFTCSHTYTAALPQASNTISNNALPSNYRPGGTCYTTPLTMEGAIIANNIKMWRTGGTVSKKVVAGVVQDSTGNQDFNEGLTGAETFRLVPEIFVAPRFGEGSTNGSPGKKQLDSLISLPPPF